MPVERGQKLLDSLFIQKLDHLVLQPSKSRIPFWVFAARRNDERFSWLAAAEFSGPRPRAIAAKASDRLLGVLRPPFKQLVQAVLPRSGKLGRQRLRTLVKSVVVGGFEIVRKKTDLVELPGQLDYQRPRLHSGRHKCR